MSHQIIQRKQWISKSVISIILLIFLTETQEIAPIYSDTFRRIDENKYLYDASAYNKKAQCSWTAESHCISTNEEMARKKIKMEINSANMPSDGLNNVIVTERPPFENILVYRSKMKESYP